MSGSETAPDDLPCIGDNGRTESLPQSTSPNHDDSLPPTRSSNQVLLPIATPAPKHPEDVSKHAIEVPAKHVNRDIEEKKVENIASRVREVTTTRYGSDGQPVEKVQESIHDTNISITTTGLKRNNTITPIIGPAKRVIAEPAEDAATEPTDVPRSKKSK